MLLALDVGGLGVEFCVFVAGRRHALRSDWPFIIIIIIIITRVRSRVCTRASGMWELLGIWPGSQVSTSWDRGLMVEMPRNY